MIIYDFMIHALLAGMVLAIATAPLGCFIVWRKMAYFGDALAHSSLLGVVLGMVWQVPLMLAILPIALGMALLLTFAHGQSRFSSDTLLGILAHAGLALGMVVLSLSGQGGSFDLMAYLFGDILAVTSDDLIMIYAMMLVILLILWRSWRSLILITLNEDLAKVQGVNVPRMRFILLALIALTIAMSIKLVGLLLITSLLILPAAAARYIAASPAQMVWSAMAVSLLMVLSGLMASFAYDTPTGPSIVLAGVVLVILMGGISRLSRRV